MVLAHCVETAGLDLPPHPCPAHPGLPLCWASVTPNTGIVVGLLENRPGSVLVENMLGSALLEKMLGPWVELENISGTAVGSGPGPGQEGLGHQSYRYKLTFDGCRFK